MSTVGKGLMNKGCMHYIAPLHVVNLLAVPPVLVPGEMGGPGSTKSNNIMHECSGM